MRETGKGTKGFSWTACDVRGIYDTLDW